MAAQFSVLILTAPPAGQAGEAGGAFVKIDGREALLRSVELFLNRDNVKQIQLCFMPEAAEEGKRKFGSHLSFSGVKVVTGGPRWIDQIVAAAEKLSPDVSHVLVHDAARPAVPYTDLESLMEEATKHPSVMLAAPSRAGLVEVDEGVNALAFYEPARFMQMLTPQSFTREVFSEIAQNKAMPHPSKVTLLKASPLNVRVGGSGDATLVKAMLNMLPKPKVRGPSNPFEEAQW